MPKNAFYAAWPDYFDVIVDVQWTEPVSRELLFSGGIAADNSAYFYAIVAKMQGKWRPFYIGMTYSQSAAVRNQQADHKRRYQALRDAHPKRDFLISLGTPTFTQGRATLETIGAIEGLLIYGNWHEDMANEKKVQTFSSVQHLHVTNSGWAEHVEPELAFGVFYRGRA